MKALRMFIILTAITGVLYPLSITLIAQLTMRERANGSLIKIEDKIIGSRLIGQLFKSERYFWGRPSAIDYNPLPSGGSNLGPTSEKLKEEVEERRRKGEIEFGSGSGLDPHITPEEAYRQVERVAKARGLKVEKVRGMIKVEPKKFGFIGEECVNVLELNLALDSSKRMN